MSAIAGAAVYEATKYLFNHHLDNNIYFPYTFDCSYFVQYCYKKVGVNLPRITSEQINCGKAVSQPNLKIGDLVFTKPDHVGLYVGNGNFIHVQETNGPVKINNVYAFYAGRRVA